ncbi:MAG TPA: single-stranded DNA-binding protein [Reyranella sp.]|nr:single-stranded DNA-binding protein [Reyranella sp.]
MARSLNKVQLIGNLGADPEIRSLPSGGRVAQFSVATSRQWNDQAGAKQEKTEWHRVVAWNNKTGRGLADLAEKYLKKGDKVYVEGSIEYRSYEDKKDGATKYITEIKAFEIILLGGKGGEGGEGMGRRSAAPATAGQGQGKAKEGSEFADYPEALDADDDDLPF